MSNTSNLNIEHLEPNTNQPEVVVNAAMNSFDSKITGTVTCAITSSNTLTLTQAQQAVGSIFKLIPGSPVATAAVTLNFAAFATGVFVAINSTGYTATLQISGQSLSAPTLANGATGVFYSDGSNVQEYNPATGTVADISFLIDNGSSVITTGLKGYIEVPFTCTINRATLLGDQSGSIVVNIWKTTYSSFDAGSTHPLVGDKITASAPPTISSATKSQDSTLTGWTTTITAGDILGINVDSVTAFHRVTLSLKVTRT